MSVRDEIEARLTEAFAPTAIEVIDDSERHHGHAGWREGGDTHFRITIASGKLDDLSRVDQHRAINAALADQFAAGMHALNIKVVKSA